MIEIIITIAGFLMIGGFLRALVTSLKANHEKQVDGLKLLIEGLNTIKNLQTKDLGLDPRLLHKAALANEIELVDLPNNPPEKGFVRVYSFGFLNVKTLKILLVMTSAKTYTEALANSEEIFAKMGSRSEDWLLHIQNFVDVKYPVKEVVREPNARDFINSLRYSADKFATTVPEKKAISRVIERIEQTL